MTDITCIGEILLDLAQTGSHGSGVPLFAADPGGAPANVAVAPARLGTHTASIGKTDRDGFGRYLRQVLADNVVDDAGLYESELPATMAIVSVDSSGERSLQMP